MTQLAASPPGPRDATAERAAASAPKEEVAVTCRSFHPGEAGEGAAAPPGSGYLICFEGDGSRLLPLPHLGTLTIGRAPESDLRLEDAAASRHHAEILCTPAGVAISDRGSRHGTRVGGERLSEPRPLASGEVVSIGAVTLVFHRPPPPLQARVPLDGPALRGRLEEELDRALRSGRQVPVLHLELDDGVDRPALAATLSGRLRLTDAVAFLGAGQLAVLLPERTTEEARLAALSLCRALSRLRPSLRAGLAVSPEDGCDADTLLQGARAAAACARPFREDELGAVSDAAQRFRVGEREVVAADPVMVRLFQLLRRLAGSELPILISGETGAGKEIAAAAVHAWSARAAQPLRALNCAALPETLAESELFGHERGAFSGAVQSRPGLLESASPGTVFLDEVGELSLPVQAKLLRVLETQRVTRLGDGRERPLDLRLIAATNRDLRAEVAAGRFREDLYFRLSAARVVVPPLRDRPRDLPVLARRLLDSACARAGRPPLAISPAAMQRLFAHRFPGNVRELKNAMDFAATTAAPEDGELATWHLPADLAVAAPPREARAAGEAAGGGRRFRRIDEELQELERARMGQALEAAGGVQTRAAELIGMPLRTFVTKLKQYGLPGAGRRRAP